MHAEDEKYTYDREDYKNTIKLAVKRLEIIDMSEAIYFSNISDISMKAKHPKQKIWRSLILIYLIYQR